MKLKALIICLAILLNACAMLPKKAARLAWPERIKYVAALCELDMSWKEMAYSGTMSLRVD